MAEPEEMQEGMAAKLGFLRPRGGLSFSDVFGPTTRDAGCALPLCLNRLSLLCAAIVLALTCGATGFAQPAAPPPVPPPALVPPARGNNPRPVFDLSRYEGRPVAAVELVLEGAVRDPAAEAELLGLLVVAPNTAFSAVKMRESLQALFDSERVADARIEVFEQGSPPAAGPIRLRFVVRPQVRVSDVRVELTTPVDDDLISVDELRARAGLVEPGMRVSEQSLKSSADAIQAYLRDRGFFQAEVTYGQELSPSGTGATITFRVTPGQQASVESFNIDIAGFDTARVRPQLKLTNGAPFTRVALGEDLRAIRDALIADGYLAPQLDEPQVIRDPQARGNAITINLVGNVGPQVSVNVTGYELNEEKRRELLPVLREGSVDYSAIVEGERRLRNRLQERGFFFAEVAAICSISPQQGTNSSAAPPAGTSEACVGLSGEELAGRAVGVTYEVEPGRRFRLTDVRIEGTDKITYEDLAEELRTQRQNVLDFIPFLGYGRGYTSAELLERDRRTVEARMRDLGYRKAEVEVRQGVSIDSDDLLITFAVKEGPLTRVAGVEVRGNQIYTAERLREQPCRAAARRSEPCTTVGGPYSRTLARADAERIRGHYARNGYPEADVDVSVVELPDKGGEEQVRLLYSVTEGGKVFINRIIINPNEGLTPAARLRTDRTAILEAIPLQEGAPLRADRLSESERILYETGAFRQVLIRTEPKGETASGYRQRDVIIDLEELPPRRLDYGGGFSTDGGPLGIFEIQNNNLFGELRQGALRLRGSRRQQLLRVEFFDPRFRTYGQSKFSPLAVSAQYQRDVSVTRFFRSTIDRGNFGIVQRLDAEGNPILIDCRLANDVDCERTGEPTINRFTLNVETQRILEEQSRTILFVRFNYEDVRLFNIGSLLVAPILQPDKAVRLSRLGATLARDTRDRQFDPTRGEFLTVDFALALRQLGGNLSFSKLQATYRRYYKFGGAANPLADISTRERRSRILSRVRGTVFAVSATLGAANLFNAQDRNEDGVIDGIDQTLPISERFFSGGSTTLRGFRFEEAGPRLAICPGQTNLTSGPNCPGAIFRNDQGEPVTLNPFLVPIGGNALAVVNLEARVPVARSVQLVPFYDGGNVFRRVGDIFGGGREPSGDLNARNLRAQWTHTVGLGLRVSTPLGPLSVDYGFLLNPPQFELPQAGGDPAIIRPRRGQLHFRFGQTF
ncbi:MAG: POTRA domain-containing protein [Pyrinomonadaceae bacterium]